MRKTNAQNTLSFSNGHLESHGKSKLCEPGCHTCRIYIYMLRGNELLPTTRSRARDTEISVDATRTAAIAHASNFALPLSLVLMNVSPTQRNHAPRPRSTNAQNNKSENVGQINAR